MTDSLVADRPAAMARALGLLLLAGATVGTLWLLLPHPAVANDGGLAALVAATAAVGLVLTVAAPRVPPIALQGCVAALTVAVSAAVYLTHEPGSSVAFFYLWATPYAFTYFSNRQAALQAGLTAAGLAVALAAQQADDPALTTADEIGRWLIAVSTVLAVGFLVRRLRSDARRSDQRFRRGFHDSTVPAAIVSTGGGFLEVNDALCRLLDHPRAALLTRTSADVSHPDDVARTHTALERARVEGTPQQFRKRCVRRDGRILTSAVDASFINDGRDGYFIVQAQDITEQIETRSALERRARQQELAANLGRLALREPDLGKLLDQVVDHARLALCIEHATLTLCDPDGGHERVVAGTPAQPGGASLTVPIASPHRRWGALAVHTPARRHFAGHESAALRGIADLVAGALQRREANDQLRHQALHDPLTGLPNRALALDRLAVALDRRRRDSDPSVAALVIDIDDFKVVNDSLGHVAGDEMLNAIAPRLSAAVSPADTVARIGGDQFLVISDDVDSVQTVTRLAERLAAAVAQPVLLTSGQHFMTASLGIAVGSPLRSTPDGLVRDAVAAMHRAKGRGRGRYELFDEHLRREVVSRMRMENELRGALERREIEVHYQPIVCTSTGEPTAVEALARWNHPEYGSIPPSEFIAIAEATGLIGDLGAQVLERACRQVAAWQRAYPRVPPIELSVNVSGHELADAGFAARTAAIVADSGLVEGTLGLEITETVLMEEAEAPVTVLSDLRAYGLRLSLDDFGTGYSSLSYLKRFPLDVLKIDRAFVAGLGSGGDDEAIVEAIISLAETLGLATVAEGVETEEQRAQLERLGCTRSQGYRFAAALTADEYEAQILRPRSPAH